MSKAASPAVALCACATWTSVPAVLPAQDFLDRGTFIIAQAGVEIGREEFAIRSTAAREGQAGILAVSTTRLSDRELRVAMELTADHTPVSFQETATQNGRVVSQFSGQLAGHRFSLRQASQGAESAREFPVRPPVVVLGTEAVSPFYFVPRAQSGQPRSLVVVRPGDTRAVQATIEAQGPDSVTLADRPVACLRFRLSTADGDVRLFWFTSSGDLLRVAVPARELVATRSEPPRR
jgi:hypothetical protein